MSIHRNYFKTFYAKNKNSWDTLQRFLFGASLLRQILQTLSFYTIFLVPEDFEFFYFFLYWEIFLPLPGDFEFLRYFQCTGDFELLRYFPCAGRLWVFTLFPDTLSLNEKCLCWDFSRYWRLWVWAKNPSTGIFLGIGDFEFEQKIPASIVLSSANHCTKTY